MNDQEVKKAIEAALKAFLKQPLAEAALHLFEALGYTSQRRLKLSPKNFDTFITTFDQGKTLNERYALPGEWKSIDFLFQLTDDEIHAAGNQQFRVESKGAYNGAIFNSYLFFALELRGRHYTRTALAGITRELNKLFDKPVLVLFRHGETLTLAVINRRPHKRDADKYVLDKVTLIKDIGLASTHRAHTEILFALSLAQLQTTQPCDVAITNFVTLHNAWQKTLDIQTLNKRFFIEIRNWFYWARLHANFPDGARKDADNRDSEALIRLLTRMIFCWFLHEKKLIPENFFAARTAESLLRDWLAKDCDQDKQGRFYKAILQNLFFATLGTAVKERKFRSARSYQGKNKHYGDQRYFRHLGLFIDKAPVEELYKSIPFLNGGLFENLDEIPSRDPDFAKEIRVDGFSDIASKQPTVPDFLFFGEERPVPELAALLAETAAPKARGLLHIFRDYKFTIEENTPLEEDIALDPELLGRTFENLLATVNPETGTVARKSTGSFYTPREIVHYMAEEALLRHLCTALSADHQTKPDLEERLRELVSEQVESHRLDDSEANAVVTAISRLRILDPACGSGAFPMVLLQLLVHVLRKLDKDNVRWKAAKLATLPPEMREMAEQVFREESFDYTRKLELIKDCIHGVDIQPVAIQISKLRFFLSLIIEQRDATRIRPLPNLETKFVCANTLLGLPQPDDWELFQHQIEPKERALIDTRARYFFARTKEEKDDCKTEDRRLRRELSDFIKSIGGSEAKSLSSAVAEWDPYHGDRCAPYFDPESMFGVHEGFDISIGNPPYVRADEQSAWNQHQRQAILASQQYETLWEKWDLYVPFIECSYKLLRPGGISTLIVSDAFCHSKYAQKSQKWFLHHARILRLDFCAEVKIFDAAVHNLIYFFQRADGTHHTPERRVHRETFGNIFPLASDEQAKSTYRAFFPEDTAGQTFGCKTLPLKNLCYVSKGMVVHADERIAQGAFRMEDVVADYSDASHPRRFAEGKHLDLWLPASHKWLEWGTKRAPGMFSHPTFEQLHQAAEKILVQRSPGPDPKCCYDDQQIHFTESSVGFIPWHALAGVRNNSLKKSARYRGEKPPRPDLPKREELEETSRRFAVKYLLGVMNSSVAREFLRAHRRSNIHLYPDDWKQLPIPDVPLSQQIPIVALVDEILTAKRANPNADLTAFEAALNDHVAALYGLTPDEIRLVEESARWPDDGAEPAPE
jgi:hypothetical protein